MLQIKTGQQTEQQRGKQIIHKEIERGGGRGVREREDICIFKPISVDSSSATFIVLQQATRCTALSGRCCQHVSIGFGVGPN